MRPLRGLPGRNLTGGVRHDLGVDRLGVLGQCRLVVGGVGAGHEGGFNAEAAQGYVQLGDGAAVQLRRSHNVVALLAQSREGDELGSHAGCGRYRTDAAFEGGDALLQRGNSGVGQARVDVAVLLQGEEVRGVVSVFEDEGGSLVDGDRAGTVFASGVPPACSARVRKPKVCSAIGLLLVYLPACVRGVDSGSTLYCATGGGVHQVRVPICRLLRIMTGYFWRAGTAVRS